MESAVRSAATHADSAARRSQDSSHRLLRRRHRGHAEPSRGRDRDAHARAIGRRSERRRSGVSRTRPLRRRADDARRPGDVAAWQQMWKESCRHLRVRSPTSPAPATRSLRRWRWRWRQGQRSSKRRGWRTKPPGSPSASSAPRPSRRWSSSARSRCRPDAKGNTACAACLGDPSSSSSTSSRLA